MNPYNPKTIRGFSKELGGKEVDFNVRWTHNTYFESLQKASGYYCRECRLAYEPILSCGCPDHELHNGDWFWITDMLTYDDKGKPVLVSE